MPALYLYHIIMKKFTILFLLLSITGFAQITSSPSPALANGQVVLTFNRVGTPLASASGLLYAHIGLTVNGTQWTGVKGTWGNNTTQPAFTQNGGNTYQLTLAPDLYTYFGIPTTSTITQICIVVRNAAGNVQTSNIFVPVGAFQVTLTAPAQNSNTIITSGGSLNIAATNTGGNASYNLLANGTSINSNPATASYSYTHSNITSNQSYTLTATMGTDVITKNFSVIVNPGTQSQAMPAGLDDGINYVAGDNTRAYLVLDAPLKDFVYVAGSFNNWQPNTNYAMKKDPVSGKFWLELTNLVAGTNYTYQYWVVDTMPIANSPALVKTADPYSTLVLSPFDDPEIAQNPTRYPNLPAYPTGQEREVTVLQTGQAAYNWQVTNFQKPKKEDLVVYEALVRDFDADRTYQDLIDKIDYFKNLKINALELLPVMEFEGNESWGYNTCFHMANDKFYGPSDKLKELIDLCHQNGIAVVLDLALNHAFGRNPMVRMWMNDPDGDGWGDPSTESPYFNTVATHSYSVGSDFNHQQARTKNYTKRVIKHWIENYHIDGFRWDLTKGFTQNCLNSQSCTDGYQQDRVDILKEYADYSWSIDPNHYVIFEHLGNSTEESTWANYRAAEGKGIMLWGNLTGAYGQLTMGWASNSNINGVGHVSRGFNEKRLVGYAESHDEERLMYKNLQNGNSSTPSHNVRSLNTALSRMSALGAVLFPVPGPKMIWHFGELGWDKSIYTCNNGTVNLPGGTDGDCKLDTKQQPQWTDNWMANVQRMKIYNDWAKMIALKVNEPVFEGEYAINSGTLLPRIYVYNNSLPSTQLKNVVVLANFDVTAQNITPDFPYTGAWYNLMDNSPYPVTNTAGQINLQPGEFRIYGNQPSTLATGSFEAEKVALYPNPTSDVFTLNMPVNGVEVYSITGQLVKSFGEKAAYTLYDVNDLTAGMYLVKVTDTNNRQSTTKLVRK